MGTIQARCFSLQEKNSEAPRTGSYPSPSERSPQGDVGGIGGQNRRFGAGFFKLGENLVFNIQPFKSSLDEQVRIAQLPVIRCEDHVAEDGIRFSFL